MPDAIIRLGVDSGAHLDGTLSTARSKLQRWAGKVAPEIGRHLRTALSSLGDIAGFGGIAGLAVAAKQVFDFERRLVRLQVAGRATAGDMVKLRQEIFAIATARGVGSSELLSGVEKFVEATGDIQTASDALDGFGLIAQATGADIGDISQAAAALKINMGITGKEMQESLSILAVQGKAGAVELRNFAGILPELTPQFSQFGKKGKAALIELGAVAQVVKSGFASAAETSTGLQGLMTALVKRADKLKGIGVHVFEMKNGKKELRDFSDIVFDLIDKSKGDPQVLQKVLGRSEAVRAILPIMNAGREGVAKFTDDGKSMQEMLKDAGTIAESAAGRMAKLKASLEQGFSKAMSGNLQTFADAMERIVAAVRWLIEHPATAALGYLALKVGPGGLPGLLGGVLGGGKKGLAGAAEMAGIGVTKVFVTNWPAGMGAGGAAVSEAEAAAGAAGVAGAARRRRRMANVGKGVLGAIGAILPLVDKLSGTRDLEGGDVANSVLGGMLAGGPIGAAIGLGVAGGGWLGEKLGEGGNLSGGTAGTRADATRYGPYSRQAMYGRLLPGLTAYDAGQFESQTQGSGLPASKELAQGAAVRNVVDQALAPLEAASQAMQMQEAVRKGVLEALKAVGLGAVGGAAGNFVREVSKFVDGFPNSRTAG